MANYWDGKQERASKAVSHTKDMEERYGGVIESGIKGTSVYGGPDGMPHGRPDERNSPEIILQEAYSVSALFVNLGRKTAVLNFASYKHPGGKFIEGSSAQEESLCHASTLYNVLSHFDSSYYEWNRHHLNRGLYEDRALYSPGIAFEQNGLPLVAFAGVITCAAPNKAAWSRYGRVSDEENSAALRSRITLIRDIAEENYVETLILGAFGCGVFRQSPSEVSKIFKDVFSETSVKRLIFAIPRGENMEAFMNTYGIRK